MGVKGDSGSDNVGRLRIELRNILAPSAQGDDARHDFILELAKNRVLWQSVVDALSDPSLSEGEKKVLGDCLEKAIYVEPGGAALVTFLVTKLIEGTSLPAKIVILTVLASTTPLEKSSPRKSAFLLIEDPELKNKLLSLGRQGDDPLVKRAALAVVATGISEDDSLSAYFREVLLSEKDPQTVRTISNSLVVSLSDYDMATLGFYLADQRFPTESKLPVVDALVCTKRIDNNCFPEMYELSKPILLNTVLQAESLMASQESLQLFSRSAEALSVNQDPAAREALLKYATSSPTQIIRYVAISNLGPYGRELPVRDVLVATLFNDRETKDVRLAALTSLERRPDQALVDRLAGGLQDSNLDPAIRSYVESYLPRIKERIKQ